MILTRRKISQPKTLKNGIWKVKIDSIAESIVNSVNVLVFKFKCDSGITELSMPIDNKLHKLLCDLMLYCDLKEYTGLEQFIGRQITIEIINKKVKYIYK